MYQLYFSFKSLGVEFSAPSTQLVSNATRSTKHSRTCLAVAIRLELNKGPTMIALKRLGKKYNALHQPEISAERIEDAMQQESSKVFTMTVNNVSEETQLLTGGDIHNEYL